jgi:hypothetical protein
MSRFGTPPAGSGRETAGRPSRGEQHHRDVAVDLVRAADAGYVVEWQLLPLVARPEPAKRSRSEKPATVRLFELGWQG